MSSSAVHRGGAPPVGTQRRHRRRNDRNGTGSAHLSAPPAPRWREGAFAQPHHNVFTYPFRIPRDPAPHENVQATGTGRQASRGGTRRPPGLPTGCPNAMMERRTTFTRERPPPSAARREKDALVPTCRKTESHRAGTAERQRTRPPRAEAGIRVGRMGPTARLATPPLREPPRDVEGKRRLSGGRRVGRARVPQPGRNVLVARGSLPPGGAAGRAATTRSTASGRLPSQPSSSTTYR